MNTNKNYIIRSIMGECILVPVGEAAQKMNGLINLNSTAEFIWRQVDLSDSVDEIITKLQDEFEIDPETAKTDVNGLLHELYDLGFVENIPEFE